MNKQDLIRKVAALGCAVEIDLDDGRNKTTRVIAPEGKNFGGNHEEITTFYSGSASDLYRETFANLEAAIVGLQDCTEDNCGAWTDGSCEYWQT